MRVRLRSSPQDVVDVGTDGQAIVKDQLGRVLGKAHAAGQELKREQRRVALLEEALEEPPLASVLARVGLKERVDGLVAAGVEAGVEEAESLVKDNRQGRGRGARGVVPLGQLHCPLEREQQVVFEDAIALSPRLGVCEVNEPLVAGIGAEGKVVEVIGERVGQVHRGSFVGEKCAESGVLW